MGTTPKPGGGPWGAAAHPHVRGDDSASVNPCFFQIGSPPRAWGRRAHDYGVEETARLTPTCVGTTPRWTRCGRQAPVHPHVRGDDFMCAYWFNVGAGSPPRAWGRHTRPGDHMANLTVHPHVRGDDTAPSPRMARCAGSPPRAWGRLRMIAKVGSRSLRFTPTCVGTTGVPLPCTCAIRGSPPRAWGRRSHLENVRGAGRFTPTCVGTTSERRKRMTRVAVHPHVRGDDHPLAEVALASVGSPPRAWGRRNHTARQAASLRFTPTCVGTTDLRAGPRRGRSVHPHVRGDD